MNKTLKETKKNDDMWLTIFSYYLGDKKMIIKTLEFCNIKATNLVEIEKHYTIGKDRSGVILKIKNPENKKIERTIIDIIHGENSSYQQLLDVTFNVGKNCENRIIIFDGVKEGNNPSSNGGVIDDFIEYINDFDQNIYQLRVNTHFFIGLSTLELLSGPPSEGPAFIPSELPGLRQFQDSEFWQFYHYPNSGYHPSVDYEFTDPEEYLFCYGHTMIVNYVDTYLYWDEEGVIYQATGFSSEQEIRKMLADKRPEIRKWFSDKEVVIKTPEKKYADLQIIFDVRPMNSFYHLSQKEKIKLADLVSEEFFEFTDLIRNYFNEAT